MGYLMISSIQQSSQDTLGQLRNSLKDQEDGYNELQRTRLDEETLNQLNSEKLNQASELVTEGSNEYSKIYSLTEETVVIYENLLELFDFELVDGRTVSDIFIELEEAFDKVENLSSQFDTSDKYLARIAEDVTKIYGELDKEEREKLALEEIKKGLGDMFDSQAIGQTP